MQRRALAYEGVKMACELHGRRHQRFVLHPDQSQAPKHAKVLYLLRHGEAGHNVWRKAEFDAGRTPTAKRHNADLVPAELHDPRLTSKGEADARLAAVMARGLPTPEVIVTSPMRRAVQTALIAFDEAVSAGVPVVAHELCREAWIGSDPSIWDSRLARGALLEEFPQVDYTRHVFEEEDPPTGPVGALGGKEIDDPLWWWCDTPYGWSHRGFDEAIVAEHAHAFLAWLMARSERTIAVASHSHFLMALCHAGLDATFASPQVLYTGELRAVAVSRENAPETTGHYHTNPF